MNVESATMDTTNNVTFDKTEHVTYYAISDATNDTAWQSTRDMVLLAISVRTLHATRDVLEHALEETL
jgi:hypothetical protein